LAFASKNKAFLLGKSLSKKWDEIDVPFDCEPYFWA